jgi:hypothetical protein
MEGRMTKSELGELADEIMCLGTTLLEKAPIKQEEKIKGALSTSASSRSRPSYLFRPDPPPETYISYSWGLLNDELKSIQSEATQQYQQFYSSALKLIKKHHPDRELEFTGNYRGKNYSEGVLDYLNLTTALYHGDRASIIQRFEQKLSLQKNIVLSIEIDDDREFNAISHEQDVLKTIEQVCNRFHRFAVQLRKTPRKDQSIPQLSIQNEYDVQYLLRAILSLHFDDIRPEEPGGSSAGSSSKADFWLDDEKVVIETKYRGSSLADKKLKTDLNTDIGDYQKIAHCQTIVFFIYDPENRIENPDGFEKDFNNRTHEKLTIKTFIRPKP